MHNQTHACLQTGVEFNKLCSCVVAFATAEATKLQKSYQTIKTRVFSF